MSCRNSFAWRQDPFRSISLPDVASSLPTEGTVYRYHYSFVIDVGIVTKFECEYWCGDSCSLLSLIYRYIWYTQILMRTRSIVTLTSLHRHCVFSWYAIQLLITLICCRVWWLIVESLRNLLLWLVPDGTCWSISAINKDFHSGAFACQRDVYQLCFIAQQGIIILWFFGLVNVATYFLICCFWVWALKPGMFALLAW